MLTRVRKMLAAIGGDRRRAPRFDRVKQDVRRRQLVVAHELAPITGLPPRKLLDYNRADRLLKR